MSGDTTPPVPPADPQPPVGGTPAGAAVPPAPVAVPAEPMGPERRLRGFLLSLLAIPAGILVFTLIWNLGFISAIVGFGVAFVAFFLYRLGSGGRISIPGALIITGVTVVALVAAYFFASIISPYANHIAATQGYNYWLLIIDPTFWSYAIADRMRILPSDFWLNGGLTLVFGVVGCFAVLRGVFQQAGQAPAVPPQAPPAA